MQWEGLSLDLRNSTPFSLCKSRLPRGEEEYQLGGQGELFSPRMW